ncbi:MAG: ABC transporter ATP-binding protein [Planctomycetaceae bacterium]|nr:ABC transporter ATP-binding protein [Planctomycetaceae bacterium]
MRDVVIQVEKLSKRYKIGAKQPYHRFSEFLNGMGQRAIRWPAKALRGRASSHDSSADKDDFWALKDVSFDVKEGEVVGIIGRNGAGKSTLLKILSRITEPTAGRFGARGRVGSLLEVGTGFHPELTGRENIYLCGTVLGMTRREVSDSFDEIVDFSGVQQFIDTPVKRYSSGMQVRLGFSVAAHLRPEILIVDEVLAVGDAEFQKKCLGKLRTVAEGGRTIMFVSHDLGAIHRLCDRGILLEAGHIAEAGDIDSVLHAYRASTEGNEALSRQIASLPTDPDFEMLDCHVEQGGVTALTLDRGQSFKVHFRYLIKRPVRGLRIYFDIVDEFGGLLVRSFHDHDQEKISEWLPGCYSSTAVFPAKLLAPKLYHLVFNASIFNNRNCMAVRGVGATLQLDSHVKASMAYVGDPIRSQILPDVEWFTKALESGPPNKYGT